MFDRQALVSHLYEGLPDKSYIHTNRRLERIEHTETGVCIHLADGSVEAGDMVIGADGVHSLVRQLMWDYASEFEPGTIPENEKEVMRFSEFRGIFGVSTVKDSFNLGPADTHVILGQDNTKMVFTQHGKVYWGITFKDEAHLPEKRDKATEADIEAVAKNFADHPITEKIKVGDLWGTNIRNGLLTVEEGVLGKWYAGRIVLVGDSVHKVQIPFVPASRLLPDPTKDDRRHRYGCQYRHRICSLSLQYPPPRVWLHAHSTDHG